jgi:hypothetical protein
MRRFFNHRSVRERVMMLAFALIGAAWWSVEVVDRASRQVREWHSLAREADVQRLWLEKGKTVGQRAAEVARQLDPAKTMNATQAYAELSRLAQGMPVEMGGQRTDRTENFSLHSLQVTIRRTDMASLLKFYTALNARTPYVGIEQCTISQDRSAPGMVNAVFRVYAIEAAGPSTP